MFWGIANKIKILYQAYFQMKIGHQYKSWAPHTCFYSCTYRDVADMDEF